MITIEINNKKYKVNDGTTILNATKQLGYDIPTMCFNESVEHFTSCMICVIKDLNSGNLIPSCSTYVKEGMKILTEDNEINEARKTALELLLSEHIGDCEAPCRIACPAFMNIPLMNRYIASNKFKDAYNVVIKDIALPGVLGQICHAPCELVCKRKVIDNSVSICILKRFVANYANQEKNDKTTLSNNIKIAIIGSGPSGLSAALYLQGKGFQADIYDDNNETGGGLIHCISNNILDKSVLHKDIANILNSGVIINQNTYIDKEKLTNLISDYNAVILAVGNTNIQNIWGIELVSNYLTNIENLFVIPINERHLKKAVYAVAKGKNIAQYVEQHINNSLVEIKNKFFNSTIGKLKPEEYSEYLKETTISANKLYKQTEYSDLNIETAKTEAMRCMHCDCRKITSCKLRDNASKYNVSKKRFAYLQRNYVKKHTEHKDITYEPGKCIKCGICVRVTAKYSEKFGFTYIGRGFSVEIGVPFNESLKNAFNDTALIVADYCPTGALARSGKQ